MSRSQPLFVDPGGGAALSFRVSFGAADEAGSAGSGIATLSLVGELDCDTAPDVISILDAIETVGFTRIHVAAAGLRFLDCSGLRVLEQTAAYLAARGGSLHIVDPSPAVDRLLAIVRSNDLMSST